jgi:hypothetical protein
MGEQIFQVGQYVRVDGGRIQGPIMRIKPLKREACFTETGKVWFAFERLSLADQQTYEQELRASEEARRAHKLERAHRALVEDVEAVALSLERMALEIRHRLETYIQARAQAEQTYAWPSEPEELVGEVQRTVFSGFGNSNAALLVRRLQELREIQEGKR